VPVLEASDESLKNFSAEKPQAPAAPPAPEPQPATSYPPLEPPTR
jgi:hypothetical protein